MAITLKGQKMNYQATGWKNKLGTSDRACRCGSWSNHWLNYCGDQSWPSTCSVAGCNNRATVGGHVINSEVVGEFIVPLCDSCNKLEIRFALKINRSLSSANRALTCEKYR